MPETDIFYLVDGEVITGKTAEEAREHIRNRIPTIPENSPSLKGEQRYLYEAHAIASFTLDEGTTFTEL